MRVFIGRVFKSSCIFYTGVGPGPFYYLEDGYVLEGYLDDEMIYFGNISFGIMPLGWAPVEHPKDWYHPGVIYKIQRLDIFSSERILTYMGDNNMEFYR